MVAATLAVLVLQAAKPLPPPRLRAAAQVVETRLERLGGSGAVTVRAPGTLVVSGRIPRGAAATLGAPGRLAIYDEEASLRRTRGGPFTCGPVADACPGVAAPATRTVAYRASARPLLGAGAVASATPDVDPTTGRWVVILHLTPAAGRTFDALTRRLAERGLARRSPQHFAIVLDDRLLTWPAIDYTLDPHGMTGVRDLEVVGRLTRAEAQAIAAELASGPLPERFSRR